MTSREPARKELPLPVLALLLPVEQPWCLESSVPRVLPEGEKMSLLGSLIGLVTVVFVSGMAMPWCYGIEVTFKGH